jgi:DNA-binding transcriptional ArsR family regulator
MTDHSVSPDLPTPVPDYDLADALTLVDPAQYGALFEETRERIISLLSERAATISELAAVLGKPKGTVGHHIQVLADAGLVHVVRTEKVRALEAKYWGRTARVFFYHRTADAVGEAQRVLERSAAEVGRVEAALPAEGENPDVLDANRRDVRIPAERAGEYQRRLAELLLEFAAEPRAGDTTYAVVYAVFPTEQPALPQEGEDR